MQKIQPKQKSGYKKKLSKEELEERARVKAHRQELKQLKELEMCINYEDDDESTD